MLLLYAGSVRGGPKIAFSEEVWDFGHITATYPVGHVFRVKNAGDQPLRIEQVTAGCGCTTTTLSENTVEPGKEISLYLTFDSAILAPGVATEKTVTVISNDSQASPKVVSIKAGLSYQGVAGIGIEPKWIQLEKKDVQGTVWKKVVLTNQLAAPVEVKILEATGAIAQAKLTQNRIPSNGRAELRLLVNSRKLTATDPVTLSAGNSVTLAFTTERREERVTLPVATPAAGPKVQVSGGDHVRRERN